MISNSSKIALNKKVLFPQAEEKDIEKYASTISKQSFYFKKYLKKSKKIGVHQHEYGSSLKFDFPQISVIFSVSRKKLGIKKYCFQQTKNSFSLAGMKNRLKNMFQLKKKLLPLATVDCYLRKWNKMVSTSQRISFHQLNMFFF